MGKSLKPFKWSKTFEMVVFEETPTILKVLSDHSEGLEFII